MKSNSLRWEVAGVILLCLCISVVSADGSPGDGVKQGIVDWQKALGGSGADILFSVNQTGDGGYILTGYTESDLSGDVDYNHGNRDVWVVKVDDAGSPQWKKVLGSYGEEESYSILQTTDGGYILTGYVNNWTIDFVASAGPPFEFTSLALDGEGNPHISYNSGAGTNLEYASKSGNVWTTGPVDSTILGIGYTSLAFDPSGNPHISYHADSALKYASLIGGVWETTVVDAAGGLDFGQYTSLKFDPGGNPHISYYDASHGDLRYASYDPKDAMWTIETVDSSGNVGLYTSLAFDPSGNPHISYQDATAHTLKYASKSGGVWTNETADSSGTTGYATSLAFDADGHPYISYGDYDNFHTHLAWNQYPGIWNHEIVDPAGGLYTSLAFDSKNRQHISYFDASSGHLKHAWRDGEYWYIETVDSAGTVGYWSSLAIDSSGNPYISYYDASNKALKFAYRTNLYTMDVLVMKLDMNGNTQWEKVYGGNNWEDAYSIQQTSDGGYVFAGRTTSSNSGQVGPSHGNVDFWVVKLDGAGSIQWQKVLGGTGRDEGFDIHQTSDGGYIFAGDTTSSSSGDVGLNHGMEDIWVVKLDSAGSIQWQKVLGGAGNEYTWRIRPTTDGGYFVTGWTNSSSSGDVGPNHGGDSDVWVVKLDSTGTIQWQNVLGGTGMDAGFDGRETTDGAYILTGFTTSSNSGDVGPNHGGQDIWVVKLDNTGAIQWQKPLGGSDYEVSWSIRQTGDLEYIVAGYASSNNNGDVGPTHGSGDYWLVKLHENQGILPGPVYDLVLKNIFGGSMPPETSLSASLVQLPPKTPVYQWGALSENRYVVTPDKVTWLIVRDDNASANNEKPVDYIFANVNDQTTDVNHVSTPPKGVKTRWIAGVRPPSSGMRFGTNAPGGGGGGGLVAGASGISSTCDPLKIDCTNCHALLISGGYDRDNNNIRYRDDIAAMYQTLKNTYCYPEDQIYVLMSDGTDPNPDQMTDSGEYANSDPDLDYPPDGNAEVRAMADYANVTGTLRSLGDPQTGLKQDDRLFIFTTNHGGKDPASDKVRIWLWNEEFLWDYDFVNLLPAQTKSVVMTMEQCNSGGFVDDFIPLTYTGPQERVIATAASATESSNLNYFSFYWIEGVGGPANAPPMGDDDSLVEMMETFTYANANDPAAGSQEHPQYRDGPSSPGLTLALSSCQKCPKPWVLSNCNYCQEPRDPDGDGIFEDVDGIDGFTPDDVILYFNRMESIAAEEPVCAFDTNGNARIDFADVVNLYGEVM